MHTLSMHLTLFAQNRPHPNECSGGDLDGDGYFVSWDSELVPPLQSEPMDYTPAPIEQLDHDVTIEVMLFLSIFREFYTL